MSPTCQACRSAAQNGKITMLHSINLTFSPICSSINHGFPWFSGHLYAAGKAPSPMPQPPIDSLPYWLPTTISSNIRRFAVCEKLWAEVVVLFTAIVGSTLLLSVAVSRSHNLPEDYRIVRALWLPLGKDIKNFLYYIGGVLFLHLLHSCNLPSLSVILVDGVLHSITIFAHSVLLELLSAYNLSCSCCLHVVFS